MTRRPSKTRAPRRRRGARRTRTRRSGAAAPTVAELIENGARQLKRARLVFGHGTDNARDEAAALIFHALSIAPADSHASYETPVTPSRQRRVAALLSRRVRERVPAAYLMKRMWFAGLEFQVDRRVLVPRSPIAELITNRFAPWVRMRQVSAILDIGTGSGCIAIACAAAFPRARVDAVDISPRALAVARRNISAHRLTRRVRAFRSDYFSALGKRRYDIIVSNPPYVDAREMRTLPAEYRHEPAIALAAGPDGLDAARAILARAASFLSPEGILVVEVGNSQRALEAAHPTVPFTWLEFERGGGGVFLLTRAQLEEHFPQARAARRRH